MSYWTLLKRSFSKFIADDLFTKAAALSYYTVFSLPPILLIILSVATTFFDRAKVRNYLFNEINDLIGSKSAEQIMTAIDALNVYQSSWWATAIGIGVLVFTSTTVFVTIQNTLNNIFYLKPKPSNSWWKMVFDRLLSFTLILGIAFILMVSLVMNALLAGLGDYLEILLPNLSVTVIAVISLLMQFLVITVLFAAMFSYLPDAKIKYRDALFGAFFTTILFSVGKDAISFYIGQSNTGSVYEAAGSIVVVMVWVFYASLILFYGAVITYLYNIRKYGKINPTEYAVRYTIDTIEQSSDSEENSDSKQPEIIRKP